jgi:lactoylglutathione lyase
MIQQIHHVTLMVDDIDAACDFYEQVFGLQAVNMINLDFPAQFYWIGERQQLHLTEWDDAHSYRGHVCFQTDDFMAIFEQARARGIIETRAWGKVRMLPDGGMQLFLRDPSGNLIEVSCKAGTPVDAGIFDDAALVERERGVFQSGRNDPRGRKRAASAADAAAVNAN